MRVGFVGLGLIGRRRLDLVRAGGHQIGFAVDPDRTRWPEVELPGCQFAVSLAALPPVRVDAVLVAVPHHQAAPAVRWALEGGAHVLCEKPLGLDAAEAVALCELATTRQLRLGAGFNYRFLAGVRELRTLLDRGALGPLHSLRLLLGHGGRPGMEREWKLQRAAAGGGALLDPGIHLLDLVRYLAGDPEIAGCRLRRCFWNTDVEDNASVDLACGPVEVRLEVSLTRWQNQFAIEAYGSRGMVLVGGRGGNYGAQTLEYVNRWFWQAGNDRRLHRDLGSEDHSFRLETEAFLAWASGSPRSPELATGVDGLAAAQIVERLYQRFPVQGTEACATAASGQTTDPDGPATRA